MRLAPDHAKPWKARMSTFLGTWLINSLVKKSVAVREMSSSEAIARGYTSSWRFSVCVSRNVIFMPAERVREFNLMITRFLYFELFHELEEARKSDDPFNIHAVINTFRDARGISDNDLPDDTLRKQYQTFRGRGRDLITETGHILGPALVSDNIYFRFKNQPSRNLPYPMNDLISDFCDLPTGVFDMEFIPRHEVDGWSGNIPIPKFRWYKIRAAKDSFEFLPGTSSTPHGAPVNVEVSCLVITDNQAIANQLAAMERMRFVLRINNFNGRKRIIGKPGEYCELTSTQLELPQTQGVGGHRMTFSGVFTTRPAVVS